VLRRNGVFTFRVRTARPGFILYEDAVQVAAVPFRDTFERVPVRRR
jgi:hypothetical protein